MRANLGAGAFFVLAALVHQNQNKRGAMRANQGAGASLVLAALVKQKHLVSRRQSRNLPNQFFDDLVSSVLWNTRFLVGTRPTYLLILLGNKDQAAPT
jgi:hypothetical protein